MAKQPHKKFDKYRTNGIQFFFKYDEMAPDLLHIYARHLTTPQEAIETYFDANKTTWNDQFKRFETFSDTHGIYWFWLEKDSKILIISCFRVLST